MKAKELTEKQNLFCRYYIDCDGNASEAFKMAYSADKWKPGSIYTNACNLLKRADIKARIQKYRDQRRKETEIERKNVERVLMDIILVDPADLYITDSETGESRLRRPSQLSKRCRNALKKIQYDGKKVTYELCSKVEAAKVLITMEGWAAPEQVAVSGLNPSNLELRIGFDND